MANLYPSIRIAKEVRGGSGNRWLNMSFVQLVGAFWQPNYEMAILYLNTRIVEEEQAVGATGC
jgi:hypothetical protein